MKTGKKSCESVQALQAPLDLEKNIVAEEDEEEEEEEEVTEGEEEGSDEGNESERPKLDDGFYEIECIRQKRVRKGQLQYLIKWRGWPETANTWEPLENVQSCADIIEAFEESLRASKLSKTARKRKRKNRVVLVQPKKRRSINFKVDLGQDESSALLLSDDSKFVNGNNTSKTTDNHKSEEQKQNQVIKEIMPNGSDIKQKSCIEENSRNISVLLPEHKPSEEDASTDRYSKVECTQPVLSGRCIGAKKRKSGFVKRFKKDQCDPDEAQNQAIRNAIDFRERGDVMGTEDVESVGDEASDRNKMDEYTNSLRIVNIVKPIGYSASIANDTQDVSVTFMALRSDGKEVVVDNKFLKVNNPLLLISFYEQHLRYSPT